MKLTVKLQDHSYPIFIERHALEHVADFLDPHRKYVIVTDDGVPARWVDLLQSQLSDARVITFPCGEANKSLATYESVMEQVISSHLTRKDAIIALGGGVVGDLAGFVAATYMRGIDFYNIPTTVLSQVDSSVGGKVAIDMAGYKNIVGAFHQPKAVLIDPETLSTLDQRQVSSGLVEALKMGLILDERLVELFEQEPLDLDTIIARSIDLKRAIVENDEKENGQRAILNFGHTIGHAIESAYHDVPYYHGECVGMGMLFFLPDPTLRARVQRILERLRIPTTPAYDPKALRAFVEHDKKGQGDSVRAIVVDHAGTCRIEPMTYDQIETILERSPYEK